MRVVDTEGAGSFAKYLQVESIAFYNPSDVGVRNGK